MLNWLRYLAKAKPRVSDAFEESHVFFLSPSRFSSKKIAGAAVKFFLSLKRMATYQTLYLEHSVPFSVDIEEIGHPQNELFTPTCRWITNLYEFRISCERKYLFWNTFHYMDK